MHIPRDSELKVEIGQDFGLTFDADGSVTHDDKSCLQPPLDQRDYRKGETISGIHGVSKCRVTLKFKPKTFKPKKRDAVSTHTILIGD